MIENPTPEEQLEADMRRYVYDRSPDRRLKCLDRYRERKGLPLWEERRPVNREVS